MYKFHIGQDIVCIKSHSRGMVKEGQIFVVKGLRISNCACQTVDINIGMESEYGIDCCRDCGIESANKDGVWWFDSVIFAPLDSLTDISEIEEILNQPIESLFQVK